MKKFLRFYLPITVILFSLSLFFVAYIFKDNPLLFEYLLGQARLHRPSTKATVKINGVEQPTIRIFDIDTDKFIVYASDVKETRPVIIVDRAKNDIGSTNASEGHYGLLFGRYLLQSHTAYAVVYASDMKWDYNPNLVIMGSHVSYTTPKYEKDKTTDVKVEILFKGE